MSHVARVCRYTMFLTLQHNTTLQHSAAQCSTLQHSATHCEPVQNAQPEIPPATTIGTWFAHRLSYAENAACNVLHCVALCCIVLQSVNCVAVCCSWWELGAHIDLHMPRTLHVMCCIVLQCVAVCCIVLQCVAVGGNLVRT